MKNFKFLILIFCIFAVSCSGKVRKGTYTWLSGGEGGGWYNVAGELSRLISEKEPKITINITPGGGIENPVALDNGDGEIAWGVGYVDKAAYNGLFPLYQKRYANLNSIVGSLSMDCYHFIAGADQGITTIEQFANKITSGEKIKAATSMPGTSDFVMADIILDFFDASFDMIENNGGDVYKAVYADMVNMYKDGLVDYAIVNLAAPGAIVTEMIEGRRSVILSASSEVIDYCHYTWGTIARASGSTCIPGGTYPGFPDEIPVVCHSTEILVSPKMQEATAYTITKIINENKELLVKLSPGYRVFEPKTAANSVQVPLHPGAVRYYKEIGVLK